MPGLDEVYLYLGVLTEPKNKIAILVTKIMLFIWFRKAAWLENHPCYIVFLRKNV